MLVKPLLSCALWEDSVLSLSDFLFSGESGGGKSSVHSLLLRYYDPNHGKVLFDGQGVQI